MKHDIAKLHEAGRLDAPTDGSVDAALAALEGEAVRAARDMKPADCGEYAIRVRT